jgi:hypothetical protein
VSRRALLASLISPLGPVVQASHSPLTFFSVDRTADPDTPHISLHSPPDPHHRHSIACTLSPTSLPPLTDGRPYALRIQFDGQEKNVHVWLSDRPATESPDEEAKDDIRDWELLFGGAIALPLEASSGEEDKEMWLGVSAACGGIAEIVRPWKSSEALPFRLLATPSPRPPKKKACLFVPFFRVPSIQHDVLDWNIWEASRPSPVNPSSPSAAPPPLPVREAKKELKFAKDTV